MRLNPVSPKASKRSAQAKNGNGLESPKLWGSATNHAVAIVLACMFTCPEAPGAFNGRPDPSTLDTLVVGGLKTRFFEGPNSNREPGGEYPP